MLKNLELEALRADLASVNALLSSMDRRSNPIGFHQFTARKQDLEKKLADVEARHDPNGSVGIFFGGRPVVGSRGILATFGAKAIQEFQGIVTMRLAERGGGLGRRGPIPQSGRANLLITDAVRGSFGFVLEEHGQFNAGEGEGSELKAAMKDVVDLLDKTTKQDEAAFVEAREEMDSRVLGSVQSFFRLLETEHATLRIVDEDREVIVNHDAVSRAVSRTDNTSIEDITANMTGRLYIVPYGRCFDLRTPGGDIISGKIDVESLKNITEENGDIGVGSLGTWCVVSVLTRIVRKNGIVTHTSYRLLSVISVRVENPDTPE